MKYLVHIIRFFVGVIFIISGAVKLIDPMGFSFKLEEYFAPDVLDIPILMPYAYVLAVATIIVEFVLGVALLIGFLKNLTLISLIYLTVFLGFLTFYSAYFNKVTDCGCFGDAVKFTPWQSFFKDIFLLILILFLWKKRTYIQPLFSEKIGLGVVAIVAIGCLYFGEYTENHLPMVDFRPYKIGVNIRKGMTIPENAPKPVFNYHWHFDNKGKEEIITTQGAYPNTEGTFIKVVSEKVSEGYVPPIHDFSIEDGDENFTEFYLSEPKLIAIVSYDLARADLDAFKKIKLFSEKALSKGYKVIGMTASITDSEKIVKDYDLNFKFYFTDQTTLKTIIRSNPGILVLNNGTIVDKANHNDIDQIALKP